MSCYCFFYCLCPLFLVCRFPTFLSGWQWLLGPLLPYPPLWAFRSLRPSAFVPGRLSFGCTLVGRGLLEVLYTLRAVRQPGVEGRCPAFGLISVGPRCASDSFFSGIPESCCSCLQGTLRSLPSGLCLSRMSRHILELLLSRRPSLPSSFLWGFYFFAPQWLGYLLLHCLQVPRSPGSCFGWLSDCDRMGTSWVLLFPFLFLAVSGIVAVASFFGGWSSSPPLGVMSGSHPSVACAFTGWCVWRSSCSGVLHPGPVLDRPCFPIPPCRWLSSGCRGPCLVT